MIIYRYRAVGGYYRGDVYLGLDRLLFEVELECTLAEEEGYNPVDIGTICEEIKALKPGQKYRRHNFDIECLQVTPAQFESLKLDGRFEG